MKVSKAFLLILRIVFTLFSLQFISDAFYKWDGYSFYLKFSDFLPDLSLSFVLWTIPVLPLSVILLILMLMFAGMIRAALKYVRLEHLLTLFALASTLLAVKITFLNLISLTSITSLGHTSLIIIIIAAALLFTWAIRRNTDKILSEFSARIAPLAWFFAILLVIAIPLSFITAAPDAFVTSSQSVARTDAARERPPNILLVVIDTLTAVDMEVYGYGRPTTPFIAEWAKGAVLFTRAYASSNWTSPTVMSLMTGQRPWTHGIWYMTNRHAEREYQNSLPRVLKDNGYDVYGFVQNRYAHPDTLGIKGPFKKADSYYTFWRSSGWWFDRLAAAFAERNVVKEWIFENNVIAALLDSYRPASSDTLFPSEKVYDSFLDFMSHKDRNISDRPFFAWLQLYPPHDPYLPPEPFRGMFGDANRFNTDREQKGSGLIEAGYEAERQADVDILRKRYDEFILYSDREFELFISRLSETIDLSNTIIILTGDHGESFEHGYQGHSGQHLYESLVHVPLMIRMPGSMSGRVVDMHTEQTDIAPTILELADIPIPEWIEGRSLATLVEGKELAPAPVFSMQFIENRALGEPITKGTVAVWDGDYKLIHYLEEGRSLLYNIRNDPGEMHNIIDEEPAAAKDLKILIDSGLSGANKIIKGRGTYR